MRQHLLNLFSEPGQWALLAQDQGYVIPKGDTLRASVKFRYDQGALKPTDISFKGLAEWLGQWEGMTKERALWIEVYAT